MGFGFSNADSLKSQYRSVLYQYFRPSSGMSIWRGTFSTNQAITRKSDAQPNLQTSPSLAHGGGQQQLAVISCMGFDGLSLSCRPFSTGRRPWAGAGYLTIGFYTSLSAGNLRSTLLDYARRFPQVDTSVVEEERSRLCTGLRS
jgi:hypothetical protein